MTEVQLFFAISLPWLSGALIICLLCSFANEKLPKSTIVGYGYLLGMVTVTLIMRVLPLTSSVISAAMSVLCAGCIVLLRNRRAVHQPLSITSRQLTNVRFDWSQIVQFAMLGVLAFHLYLMTINLLLKPLFAWDAWATWSVKARTWFELKQKVSFVSQATWLENADPSLHVLDAWHYPDTAPLIQTWVAIMINRWDESLVNLPWLFCLIALGAGFYGQLKRLEIPALSKTTGLYLIISVPLINTHVALAGYADLWLCTAYTFAMLALIEYLITHSIAQLGLAMLSAMCVALIKTEGVVLLLTVIPLLLVIRMPSAVLKKVMIICCISLVLMGTFVVAYSPIELNIPYLGKFFIAYHSVWDAVITNYLALPSWHLLIYLVIVGLMIASFAKSVSSQQRKLILIPALVLFGYLFVLFFLTQNYTWAEKYSSINRITLHLLPSIVFCLFLIFDKRFQNRHMLSQVT